MKFNNPEIDPWVLNQWRKAGLTFAVRLPDGHVVRYLSEMTANVYVRERNATKIEMT